MNDGYDVVKLFFGVIIDFFFVDFKVQTFNTLIN